MKRNYYLIMVTILLFILELSSFAGIGKAGKYPSETYPPNTPASEGGFEPANIFYEPWGHLYDIYFKHSDWTRRSQEGRPWETAWAIVPGHEGYIDLEINKVGFAGDANYVCIDSWKDPNGGKSGITWQYLVHEYSPGQRVPFGFSVSPSAPQGVYTVYMTLYRGDLWLIDIIYAKFKVYFVVRSGADTAAPKIDVSWDPIPNSIVYGEEISVRFYFRNVGTESSGYSGLQIYLEHGVFTRPPHLVGYFPEPAWGAYEYNNPEKRDVAGAPIIEIYDDVINIGGPSETDIIEVYIKATKTSGTLNIKIKAWMKEKDERLWDVDSEGYLLYWYSPGATKWPFNGEWGETPGFDDTAASSDPIKEITILPPTPIIRLESIENDEATKNLGQIRFDGTLYSLPVDVERDEGTYSAEFLAPEGYKFKQWVTSGDISVSSGTSNPTQVNINGDGTLRAIYVKVYEINVLPNGGEIIVDDKESVVISKKTYYWEKGSEHTLEAVSVFYPENDLKLIFTRWSDGYTNRRRTIIITGDANYRAEWDVQYKVNIEVSPSGGGTTDPSPDTYWCDENSRLTVTAIPASSYSFSHWIVDDETFYTNPIDIQIDEPHTLTAVFTENPTLIVQTNPSLAGIHFKIDGADYYTSYDGSFTTELEPGSHTIELIDTIKIEDENTKYEFSHWSEAASGSQNPVIVEITSDDYLTANFDTYYKVSFTQAGVEQGRPVIITVDGEEHSGYTIYTYDKWILNGGYVSFEISSIIESSVTGKRYVFDHWEDGEGYTVTSPQMIDEPEVFTAYYTIEYHLDVSTVPDGLTAPQIDPLGPWYAEGTEVTCTAAQIEGYEFDYWILDGKPQEAGNTELTVIMDAPHQAIAHYTPITTETWIFPVQIGTETYNVAIESNSTVSNFHFDEDEGTLTFQVEGPSGTKGFCEVVVPTALMQNPFTVKIDGATILENHYAPTNGTHYFIQFTYIHTTHTIEIIPEFTPILFLTAVLTLTTIAFVKKKTIKH